MASAGKFPIAMVRFPLDSLFALIQINGSAEGCQNNVGRKIDRHWFGSKVSEDITALIYARVWCMANYCHAWSLVDSARGFVDCISVCKALT